MNRFDQWLTTDKMAEAADREYEAMLDAWTIAVNEYDLPVDADEPEHPEHAIFAKWKVFYEAVRDYRGRLEAEAEAAMYAEEDDGQ